jgi:hypothetical protein
LFSVICSVSTRDAEGPKMFRAEEVDGIGDKGSGEITTFNLKTLLAWGLFLYC